VRLWRFIDPLNDAFARAGGRGTWYQPGEGKPSERVRPLIIEWEPGSDVIGNFTWPGLGIIVTESVGRALSDRFRGFELGPVEMVQDAKLKRPQRVTRRTKPRVWLPYEGPPLYDLWVTAWVTADLEQSTLNLKEAEVGTDTARYQLEGHERIEYFGVFPDLVRKRIPREPGKGVYAPEKELRHADIFHLRQIPGWVFCTDAVRDFVLESKFTNVDFFEMGETF